MSRLASFFHGADTTLGVFYPAHYIVAIFRDLDQATAAEIYLRRAGFSENEVIAVPGDDLRDLVREESGHGGILAYLSKELSRFLHTEAVYTDRDLHQAEHGAAMIAVHCPDARAKDFAWRTIAPERPLAARYYAAGAIEHLAGES